jgi:hypothetical protein
VHVTRAVLDKRVRIGKDSIIGGPQDELTITMVGKNATVPPGTTLKPGAVVWTDVGASDFTSAVVEAGDHIQTRRLPYEL